MLAAMSINERYATAVNSKKLTVEERTRVSDSDVLGAYGLADKALQERRGPRPASPLAVPLERLLMGGDDRAAPEICRMLAGMVWRQARAYRDVRVTYRQAEDMAKSCLSWFRQGTCKACGGHGFSLIPGTVSLSANQCEPCEGSGKRPLESEFPKSHRELARWTVGEMERALGVAGPEAMQKIAPRLEL